MEKKKITKEITGHHVKKHVWDILRLVPDEELAILSRDLKVDYCTKVLTGERMFYLLLYAFLVRGKMSLRNIADLFKNRNFQTLFNISTGAKVVHSSISARLAKIDPVFFQKAFELLYKRVSEVYGSEEIKSHHLVRVDSTMVAETCNKLKRGMSAGQRPSKGAPRKQVKYTMAYDGMLPECIRIFDRPTYLSEDMAMPEVLGEMIKKDKEHANLYVFDRGLSSNENFSRLTAGGARFVGRIKTGRRLEAVRSLITDDTERGLGNLVLTDDILVHLYDTKERKFAEETFRVVKAEFKEHRDTSRPKTKGKAKRIENEVFFITNDMEMSAGEIAEAYRKRWDIEVFFKFLKQHFDMSHILTTSENGMKIVLYMTLISYMLIMLYKRENELAYDCGRVLFFNRAKFLLGDELSEWVADLTVVISKENPLMDERNIMRRYRIP